MSAHKGKNTDSILLGLQIADRSKLGVLLTQGSQSPLADFMHQVLNSFAEKTQRMFINL